MITWLLMLALQPVLAVTVYRITQGRRRLALSLMLVAGVLVLFKAVVNGHPVWEAAVFPFADYVKYQGFVLYVGAAIFFGACVTLLGARRDRRALMLLFLVVAAQSGWANQWLTDRTVYGEDIFADKNLHCPQSTLFTCAPAACVAALAHCGVRVSERQMATLCLTSIEGTSHFNVYRGVTLALVGSPWRARLQEITTERLTAKGTIAVFCLPGHAIATVGEGEGTLLLHDPQSDKPTRWQTRELGGLDIYDGTAVVIEIR